MGRGVHGSSWVGLGGFFDPTHHGGFKKIQPNPTHYKGTTQPKPTHIDWVEPMGWTIFFLLLLLLTWAGKIYIPPATWVDK